MDQPAASVKGTFEHGFPNYRESAPCTVGARGFEREREIPNLMSPADPNLRQPGSRIKMLPFSNPQLSPEQGCIIQFALMKKI